MSAETSERIAVVAGRTTLGVTLTMGEVQVSVRIPRPAGTSGLTSDGVRAGALRNAKRALEAAVQDLEDEIRI